MPLRVYNTLTQTKEPFQTVRPSKVGMYVCGPTVYSESHIGHMVGPVIFDTIKAQHLVLPRLRSDVGRQHHGRRRQADRPGAEGRHDRQGSRRECDRRLPVLPEGGLWVNGIDLACPGRPEHIGDIIEITAGLIEKVRLCVVGRRLLRRDEGRRIREVESPRPRGLAGRGEDRRPSAVKRTRVTSALWKGSKPGEPSWKARGGPADLAGHIEVLGHEHEASWARPFRYPRRRPRPGLPSPRERRSSSPSRTPVAQTFATYWLHNGLLTKDPGKKISKSDPGTVVLMADLLKAHDPDTLECGSFWPATTAGRSTTARPGWRS